MKKPRMSPARKEPDKTTYSGRFAMRLRSLREKAGVSPKELADAVGAKSFQTIYDWESGKVQPKISQLPIIAESLGIKPRTLIPEK